MSKSHWKINHSLFIKLNMYKSYTYIWKAAIFLPLILQYFYCVLGGVFRFYIGNKSLTLEEQCSEEWGCYTCKESTVSCFSYDK